MKKLTLKFTIGKEATTETAKSEANMWTILRKMRDSLTDADLTTGARCKVYDEDKNLFKDITFHRNSKGKIEMPNAVKETCRRQMEKKRAELKKLEEKKAKKRAAAKLYRARLKAKKEAQKALSDQTTKTTEEQEKVLQCA